MIAKDNPNPRANIALLCKYRFFFYAFESVYENLDHVEFVIDFSGMVAEQSYPEEYKEKTRQFFQKKGVYWRDPELSDLSTAEFFSKYAILVTPFYGGLLKNPCNKNKKKVQIQYGISKESWAYGLHNAYIDLQLCAGPHSAENFKLYGSKIVATGEPKHDRFFSIKSKEDIIEELGLRLDAQKETLLYLPTWGSLSSVLIGVPALIQLSNEYNIVIKIHHMTALYETEERMLIENSSLQIIDETTSVMDALKIADVVISDNSSAIFDAVVTKKRLVLIDNLGESKEKFFVETLFFTSTEQGNPTGSRSHPESIEQTIKQRGKELAPVVRHDCYSSSVLDVVALRDALDHSGDKKYIERQQEISKKLFSHFDGFAGKRAAEEINELIVDHSSRDKTLERMVDEFEQRTKTEQGDFIKRANKELQYYKNIKKLPFLKKWRVIANEFFSDKILP